MFLKIGSPFFHYELDAIQTNYTNLIDHFIEDPSFDQALFFGDASLDERWSSVSDAQKADLANFKTTLSEDKMRKALLDKKSLLIKERDLIGIQYSYDASNNRQIPKRNSDGTLMYDLSEKEQEEKDALDKQIDELIGLENAIATDPKRADQLAKKMYLSTLGQRGQIINNGTLYAGGHAVLQAQNSIDTYAHIGTVGDLQLAAARVNIESTKNRFVHGENEYESVRSVASVHAGQNLSIRAGVVTGVGAAISANRKIDIEAAHVDIRSLAINNKRVSNRRSSGLFSSTNTKTTERWTKHTKSKLSAGGQIRIKASEGDVYLSGVDLKSDFAGNAIDIKADNGSVHDIAVYDTYSLHKVTTYSGLSGSRTKDENWDRGTARSNNYTTKKGYTTMFAEQDLNLQGTKFHVGQGQNVRLGSQQGYIRLKTVSDWNSYSKRVTGGSNFVAYNEGDGFYKTQGRGVKINGGSLSITNKGKALEVELAKQKVKRKRKESYQDCHTQKGGRVCETKTRVVTYEDIETDEEALARLSKQAGYSYFI